MEEKLYDLPELLQRNREIIDEVGRRERYLEEEKRKGGEREE